MRLYRRAVKLLFLFLVILQANTGNAMGNSILDGPVTINCGHLFVYGNQLSLPFVFEIVSGETLTVNGYPICPTFQNTPPAQFVTIPEDSLRHLEGIRVMRLGNSLVNDGMSPGEALDSMASHYRERVDLYDSVWVEENNIWLFCSGSERPTYIEKPTGLVKSLNSHKQPTVDRLEGIFNRYRYFLDSCGLLAIAGCGVFHATPPARAEAMLIEIGRLQDLPDNRAKYETSKYLGSDFVKQFILPIAVPKRRALDNE